MIAPDAKNTNYTRDGEAWTECFQNTEDPNYACSKKKNSRLTFRVSITDSPIISCVRSEQTGGWGVIFNIMGETPKGFP